MAQQTLNDLELGLSFRTKLNDNFTDLYTNKLDSSDYTAADVLAKLLTVDGAGSGVDADTIDGLDSTAFATSAQGALADSALQDGDTVSELTVTDFAANQITLSELNNSYPGLVVVDNIRYDTTKDSDGGKWTEKTGSLSYGTEAVPSGRYIGQFSTFASVVAAGGVVGDWYYNPSNMTFREVTSISPDVSTEIFRAGSATFPKQVVIVAEASRIIIFDATKDQLEMWRVEDYTGLTIRAIASAEGNIVIATSTGLIVSDYATPDLGSTTHDYTTSTTPSIVNNSVNDVAMTVLDSAPIDPITGLRVPTIAVATGSSNSGGLGSVIMDNGSVIDYNQGGNHGTSVSFTSRNDLVWGFSASSLLGIIPLQSTDVATVSTNTEFRGYSAGTIPASGAGNGKKSSSNSSIYFSRTDGLGVLYENPASPSEGMVAYITKDFNTGWVQGDIEVALCDSLTDRSVSATTITDNGSAVIADAATGSEQQKITATGGTITAPVTTGGAIYGWELISGQWLYRANTGWVGVSESAGTLTIADGTTFAMLRYTNGSGPSADQHNKIEDDERKLLQDNANCLLAGTSNSVLTIAPYDKSHDLLHVATSYGRSSFRDLERVESEATTVGTPSAVYGEDGVLLQGGSTGFTSAIPEVNVRSDIKHPMSYGTVLPDDIYYTAVGGETDIYLGKGFTASRVWKNAAPQKKKQGATANDFSIQYNGFEYFVRFASALTASDDIIIERARV